jgi:tetratricopeptide (TPR) repeat protein
MGRCCGLNANLRRCGRERDKKGFYLCDDHKYQPILLIVFLIFTVVGGSASIYSLFIPSHNKQTLDESRDSRKQIGEKPENPSIEKVEREIEKELKADYRRRKKKALELYQRGNKAYDKDLYRTAISYFKEALEVVTIPSLYISLGNSYLVTSDLKNALATYQTAFELSKSDKNRRSEAAALVNLGLVYRILEDPGKAIKHQQKALMIHREVEYRKDEATTLANLGSAYYVLSMFEKAIEYYNQSLEIDREIKYRQGEATTSGNLC